MAARRQPGGGVAAVSIAGALGAAGTSVLATFCCVGPVVYGVIGAGGVLAAARLAPWRPYLLAASVLFLAVGFWAAYRRRVTAGGATCPVRASRAVRATLWTAAVLTVAVAVLPEVLG
jgi:mercuric ion transport protein